jgi:c-di-GMP-binding flagellar brake protein YcgR
MSGTVTTVASNKIPLKVWDKIEIVVEKRGRQGVYVTRIEEINRNSITATKPDFVGGNQLLSANDIIFVQFKRPDAMYRFGARMQATPNNTIVITNFGSLERVQRREFVRIKMNLDIKYRVIKKGRTYLNEPYWYDATTRDISAGGILMSIDSGSVEKNDILLVRIEGYEKMGIPRLATVLCCRLTRLDDGKFAGVKFITREAMAEYLSEKEISDLPPQVKALTTKTQNKMVHYIFNEQIEERQKGVL